MRVCVRVCMCGRMRDQQWSQGARLFPFGIGCWTKKEGQPTMEIFDIGLLGHWETVKEDKENKMSI